MVDRNRVDVPSKAEAVLQDSRSPTEHYEEGSEVDPRLLEILVCPVTKTALEYDRSRSELISRAAGLAYPVRDGIPIMLVDEARSLEEDKTTP